MHDGLHLIHLDVAIHTKGGRHRVSAHDGVKNQVWCVKAGCTRARFAMWRAHATSHGFFSIVKCCVADICIGWRQIRAQPNTTATAKYIQQARGLPGFLPSLMLTVPRFNCCIACMGACSLLLPHHLMPADALCSLWHIRCHVSKGAQRLCRLHVCLLELSAGRYTFTDSCTCCKMSVADKHWMNITKQWVESCNTLLAE